MAVVRITLESCVSCRTQKVIIFVQFLKLRGFFSLAVLFENTCTLKTYFFFPICGVSKLQFKIFSVDHNLAVTIRRSSSLVCQFLSVAQFMQMTMYH